jgi:chemotaxis protein MotB
VLFAIGRTDMEKFRRLAEGLREEFGTGAAETPVDLGGGATSPIDGGAGVFDLDGAPPVTVAPGGVTAEALAEAEAEHARELAEQAYEGLAAVEAQVRAAAEAQGIGDAVAFRLEARGLVVTILTDQVLFDAGRADLQPGGLAILDVVAAALLDVPNAIAIEGHSDSRPISTDRFPSNWELSTARATSVLRELVDRHGLPAARLSAAGYADTRPIADESTPDGAARNRRVEVVVLSEASLAPLLEPELDDPADPGAAAAGPGQS